jgi:hypothetical protein
VPLLVPHAPTEKQEKRMDGFEGKLGKVVESVDQVTAKIDSHEAYFKKVLEICGQIRDDPRT